MQNLAAWDYVAGAGGLAAGVYAFREHGATKWVLLGVSVWLLYGVYQDYIGG